MSIKKWCFSIAMFCCLAGVSAQETSNLRNFPAQISIWHPVGTHGQQSRQHTYNLSLNLLYGRVGGVNGLEISGLASVVEGRVRGIQLAGLVNVVGDNVRGIQMSGFTNITGDTARGLQATVFANIVGDEMRGIQMSGFTNVVGDNLRGIQAAGFANVVGDEMIGLQMGGFANVVGDNARGIQVAGGANRVGNEMIGLQIGIHNRTNTLRGLQIGLISINDTIASGASLSLVNIVRQGFYREWQLSFSDYANIALSYKMGTQRFYTLYTIGANFIEDNLWLAGIGFGNRTPISNRIDFQPELVFYNYFPINFRNIQHTFTTRLRFGFVYSINEKLGLSLAPSVYVKNARRNSNNPDAAFYNISPFSPFYTNERGSRLRAIGAGVSLGLSFR